MITTPGGAPAEQSETERKMELIGTIFDHGQVPKDGHEMERVKTTPLSPGELEEIVDYLSTGKLEGNFNILRFQFLLDVLKGSAYEDARELEECRQSGPLRKISGGPGESPKFERSYRTVELIAKQRGFSDEEAEKYSNLCSRVRENERNFEKTEEAGHMSSELAILDSASSGNLEMAQLLLDSADSIDREDLPDLEDAKAVSEAIKAARERLGSALESDEVRFNGLSDNDRASYQTLNQRYESLKWRGSFELQVSFK